MTAPGAGQNINLAALWIPVMPETSHMGEEMRKTGAEAKREFESGFNSGASPEAMGSSFGSRLQQSIAKEMGHFELPFGAGGMFEKLNGEVDKSTEKLRGSASQALQQYREEYDKLGAAQQRATEAEQRINTAREGGFNQAHIMIPLLQEQTAAQNGLKEAQSSTGAALDNYNGKLGQLRSAHEEAGGSGAMMAGVMGGVVVAGVQMAAQSIEHVAEKIVEGLVEAFKMGVEGAEEFAHKMIEVGEAYEHIGIQVTEFSNLSGEAFESTEKAAQQVFSTLDVAGTDTGKTMAQLATSLGAPGEEIKSLVTHVEELHGRFTDLKSVDLAHIFTDFSVPAEQADAALASLLQSARGSGQDIGQLTQALSGMAGETLKEAGLNVEQAGKFMADMMQHGEPGRQAMTGMSSAMKEFGKEGLTFSDGMKLAGEKLKELGDTAEGQDMAEKLFGTRNWIVAKDAVRDYMNIVAQGPDAFNANAASLDDFIERTKTLSNQWEEVKHKAESAFLPMGLEAVKLAGAGLDQLVAFVNSHMDQIKAAVKGGGDFIIKFAAQTEQLAIGVLEFFSPVVGAIERMMSGALISLGDFANVTGQILSYVPGMKDIGQGISDAGKAADGFGHDLAKVDVGKGMGDLAEWLKKHPIDVDAATKSWDTYADHVSGAMNSANDAASKAGGWFKAAPDGVSAPTVGTGRLSTSTPGAGTPIGPMPAIGGASSSLDSALQGQGLSPEMIRLIKGFSAVEGNNPAGNPTLGFVDSQLGGASDTQSHVAALVKQIQDRSGVSGAFPEGGTDQQQAEWIAKVVGQNGTSSDWEGNAQPKDYVQRVINAMGGAAAPSSAVAPPALSSPPYISPVVSPPVSSGGPTSPNGLPIGAPLTSFNVNGVGTQDASGDAGQRLQQFAQWFNDNIEPVKELSGYDAGGHGLGNKSNHTSGSALDINWSDFTALQGHGADATSHFTPAQMQEISQQLAAMGMTWGQYWTPDSRDPGHFEIGGASYDTGAKNLGPGTTPGGKNGAAYPGMPGQYGGQGVYGGETADQAFSAQQAVQEARDRQSDLDYQVTQHQQKVNDIKAELGQGDPNAGKKGLLGGPLAETPEQQKSWADKQKSLNEQLASATHDLTVSLREQGEQGGKVTEAQRKQQEAMYKKPTGTQAGGNKDAQSLGSGLLSGIGEELGLGTVFGKSPLDWGIVKLAEGLFNYANNLGDAAFGQTGAAGMGGPGGSGGLAGGLTNGLLSSVGIKAPTAMLSAGPNVVPGAPIGAAGTGGGPLPGPTTVINGDVNPIHVSPNVDPSAIMAPVQEQQNSSNSSSYQFQGSLPAQ